MLFCKALSWKSLWIKASAKCINVNVHEGHMGTTKCRLKVQKSVWWLGLGVQIRRVVAQCEVCAKNQPLHPEPMIPSELPQRPWQKVGVTYATPEGGDRQPTAQRLPVDSEEDIGSWVRARTQMQGVQ